MLLPDRAVFQSANALTTLGLVAGVLLALGRSFMDEDAAGNWRGHIWITLYLLAFLAILSIVSAAGAVQHAVWRRVYIVSSDRHRHRSSP